MQPRLILMQCLLAATLMTAGSVALAAEGVFECRNANAGDVVRRIDVEYETPGEAVPCRVRYDKTDEGGGVSYPWNAQRQRGYCEDKAAVLVERLAGYGWSCARAEDADEG